MASETGTDHEDVLSRLSLQSQNLRMMSACERELPKQRRRRSSATLTALTQRQLSNYEELQQLTVDSGKWRSTLEDMASLQRAIEAQAKVMSEEVAGWLAYYRVVESKDPFRNEPFSPSTEKLLQNFHYDVDFLTSNQRGEALITAYTQEGPLYKAVNNALRNRNVHEMRYLASFIKELRGVFNMRNVDGVLAFKDDLLFRGIQVPDPAQALKDFKVGEKFVWPGFTSTTTTRSVAERFGNLIFVIRFKLPAGVEKGSEGPPVFAPACISQFSDFPNEGEVVCPPHTEFEVLEIVQPKRTFFGAWRSKAVVHCQIVDLETGGDTPNVPVRCLQPVLPSLETDTQILTF